MKVDFGGVGQRGEWTTVNLDASGYRPAPDRVADITATARDLECLFEPQSIDAARCIHTLEHLPAWDILPTLHYWRGFLKPGAPLLIVVPDGGALVRDYFAQIIPFDVLASVLYVPGSRTRPSPLEEHRWAWDTKTLTADLLQVGYRDIQPGTDADWPLSWTLDFDEAAATGLRWNYEVPNLRLVAHA